MLISASSLPSAVQRPLSCDASKPRSSASGVEFDTHLRDVETAGPTGANISGAVDCGEKPAYPLQQGGDPASAIRTAALAMDIVADLTGTGRADTSHTDSGIRAASDVPIPKISREAAKQISDDAFRERGPNATPEGSTALSADLRANPGKYAAVLAAGYALPIVDVVVLLHRNYVSGNGLGGFELAISPIDYAEAAPQVISSWARCQFGPDGTAEGRAEVAIDLAANPEKYVALLAAGHTLPIVNMLQLEQMGFVSRNSAGGFDLSTQDLPLTSMAAGNPNAAVGRASGGADAGDETKIAADLDGDNDARVLAAGINVPMVNSLTLEHTGLVSEKRPADSGLNTQERRGSTAASAREPRGGVPAGESGTDTNVRVAGPAGGRRLEGELAFALRMRGEPNNNPTPESAPIRIQAGAGAETAARQRLPQGGSAGNERANEQPATEPQITEASGLVADGVAQASSPAAESSGGLRPSPAAAAPSVGISSETEAPTELPGESTTIFEPPSEPDDRRVSEPVRSLKLRIEGPEGRRADVGVGERAGEVKVVVRSADGGLRESLRAGLDDVVQKLEASGIQLEAWRPAQAGSAVDQRGETHSAPSEGWSEQHQGGQKDNQHPTGRERGQASGWIEEFERSLAG